MRTRIVALVLACGLPVLLLALFGLWRYLDSAKQEVVDDRIAMAEAAALTTQAFVSDVTTSAQTLALTPALLDPAQRPALPGLIDRVRDTNPDWQSIAVLDASGSSVASTGAPPANTPELQALIGEVVSTGQVDVVTTTSQPPGTRVLVGVPLAFTDGNHGILLVSPAMRMLADELRAQAHGPELDAALVDNTGAPLIAPRTPPASPSQDLTVRSAVEDTSWTVVISQPAGVAYAPLERQVGIAAGALLLALAAAGLLAWRLGGRLSEYYLGILEARDRAEEAMQARDAVLASVSHDLRNPLAAAKGYLQLAQRRIAAEPQAPAAELTRALVQTERALARMYHMTEELVDSARLRAGYELALRPALTNLTVLVQQVVDEQSAASRDQQIHFGYDTGELWISCDPARIARVVANVVSNAIKYSPADTRILIELRRDTDAAGHWAVLSVSDEGIGIPEQDMPRLFELFHRASNANSRAAGTGLGLAGARAIVDQHGGSIVIESQEGVGTTVRIRLPRSAESHVDRASTAA